MISTGSFKVIGKSKRMTEITVDMPPQSLLPCTVKSSWHALVSSCHETAIVSTIRAQFHCKCNIAYMYWYQYIWYGVIYKISMFNFMLKLILCHIMSHVSMIAQETLTNYFFFPTHLLYLSRGDHILDRLLKVGEIQLLQVETLLLIQITTVQQAFLSLQVFITKYIANCEIKGKFIFDEKI